jgi:hypothetical protein
MLVFFPKIDVEMKSPIMSRWKKVMERSRWKENHKRERPKNKKMNFPGLSIGEIADYLNR